MSTNTLNLLETTPGIARLRPLERVLAYLDATIPVRDRRCGVKIPTTREVSRQIQVSSGTVRKAYQQLARQGLIQTDVGSGTYWTKAAEPSEVAPESKLVHHVIGVNVPKAPHGAGPESWAHRIYGGMLSAAFEHHETFTMQPVRLAENDAFITDEARLDEILGHLSGFICFPTSTVPVITAMLRKRSIPYVSLNPASESATTQFVAPDYYQANRRAGRALARAGRKRPLLFLSPGTERSTSCQLRLSGFLSGLHCDGLHPEFRRLVSPLGRREVAREVFARFLDEGWIPDAVCTAGDEMAIAVLDEAESRGIAVPETMSVIGGSGLVREPRLTVMLQPLEAVGEELIRMLRDAREHPLREVPGRNLPMTFYTGLTTRPEENALLAMA